MSATRSSALREKRTGWRALKENKLALEKESFTIGESFNYFKDTQARALPQQQVFKQDVFKYSGDIEEDYDKPGRLSESIRNPSAPPDDWNKMVMLQPRQMWKKSALTGNKRMGDVYTTQRLRKVGDDGHVYYVDQDADGSFDQGAQMPYKRKDRNVVLAPDEMSYATLIQQANQNYVGDVEAFKQPRFDLPNNRESLSLIAKNTQALVDSLGSTEQGEAYAEGDIHAPSGSTRERRYFKDPHRFADGRKSGRHKQKSHRDAHSNTDVVKGLLKNGIRLAQGGNHLLETSNKLHEYLGTNIDAESIPALLDQINDFANVARTSWIPSNMKDSNSPLFDFGGGTKIPDVGGIFSLLKLSTDSIKKGSAGAAATADRGIKKAESAINILGEFITKGKSGLAEAKEWTDAGHIPAQFKDSFDSAQGQLLLLLQQLETAQNAASAYTKSAKKIREDARPWFDNWFKTRNHDEV